MATKLVIDCASGEVAAVPLTAEEQQAIASAQTAAAEAMAAEAADAQAAAQQRAADMQAVLGIVTDPAAQAALARILARALGQEV